MAAESRIRGDRSPRILAMLDVAWWSALPAIFVAAGVLLVPGFIATWSLPVGLTARVALAGPVGVAAIGLSGIWAGMLGWDFGIWQPAVTSLAIGLVAHVVARRLGPRRPFRERRLAVGYALSVAAAAVLIGVVAFAAVPVPSLVSQTYDNVFHMSAIASILADGDASSLTLRTMIETARTWSYYPSAWHSVVAITTSLTGISLPTAVNAAWLAVCASLWLPGVMWLTRVVLPGLNPVTSTVASAPLAAAFGAMPYALLSWGTLYPTFLATALLPAAVAVPVAWWRMRVAFRQRSECHFACAMLLMVVCLAIAFAQPRVLVSWALLLVPFVTGIALRSFLRAHRSGGNSRRTARRALFVSAAAALVIGAAGFAFAVTRLGLFERPLEERLGGPQATASQGVAEGLWQVLFQATPTGVGPAVSAASPALAIAVLVGAVIAARRRSTRWLVVSAVVVAVLFALAAGSDDVVTKMATALWYKDRYRLQSLLPIVGVPLAVAGVSAAVAWLARGRLRRARNVTIIAVSWLVALTSALSLGMGGMSASIASIFLMPDDSAGDRYVSRAQTEFIAEVDDIVPQGQLILGDPWDGSAWAWVYGSHEPVFPHVNGQWDEDRLTLAWRLDAIEDDPAVCEALGRLDVEYVLYSSHDLGDGDPAGNHFPAPHRAVEAGLFELVAESGESSLYRIPQCDR